MVQIHFGSSGFGSFHLLARAILRSVSISEVGDLSPHVLVDGWSRFSSGLRVFDTSSEFMNVVLGNLPEWYRSAK
jgi:hypothetical protein